MVVSRLQLASIEIAPRFCGPPASGNGGYVAGLVASFAAEPMEVRLSIPPPLATPLEVVATDAGGLELRSGERVIATATAATVELQAPPPPAFAAASDAARQFAGFARHSFPGCFVCGPTRAPGEGLRIFPGAYLLEGRSVVAAPWQPDASLAGTRGRVRPEFLWAALDCPGYYAVAPDARLMLLGSLACRIERVVEVGERCVVVAWRLDGEGRKRRAASALYGADGGCAARALATWIELKPAP
jgi:hypothetical protein